MKAKEVLKSKKLDRVDIDPRLFDFLGDI